MVFPLRGIIRSSKRSSPIHVMPIRRDKAVGKQRGGLSNFGAPHANGVSTGLGLTTRTYLGVPMILQLDDDCFGNRVAAMENSRVDGALKEPHISVGKLLRISILRGTKT